MILRRSDLGRLAVVVHVTKLDVVGLLQGRPGPLRTHGGGVVGFSPRTATCTGRPGRLRETSTSCRGRAPGATLSGLFSVVRSMRVPQLPNPSAIGAKAFRLVSLALTQAAWNVMGTPYFVSSRVMTCVHHETAAPSALKLERRYSPSSL